MKKAIKKLKFWLKWSEYKSLYGFLIGIVFGIYLYSITKSTIISMVSSIIITIITMIVIQINDLNHWGEAYAKVHKKERYIEQRKIRGYSKNLDKLLDLDNELTEFLDKYSSGKKTDYFEKELNKQWEKRGDYFITKGKKILSKLSNQELMYGLLSTNQIKEVINFFDYFEPYKIDVKFLIEHPEKAKEYYFENLMQVDAIRRLSINKYYYEALIEHNYFDKIESFILSQMSNNELMELANSSKNWRKKLYYYGFLKDNEVNTKTAKNNSLNEIQNKQNY